MKKINFAFLTVFVFALLCLSTGHAEMYLDTNGMVGIGTDTPLTKLELYSPEAITDWWPYDAYMLRLESGSAANPLNTIQIIKSYGTAESELRFDNGDEILAAIYTLSNDRSLKFLVASPEWNHVTFDTDASGDLGIHLRADITDSVAVVFNTSWDPSVNEYASKIYRPADSNDLVINLSSTGDVMMFDSISGNVGIGEMNPSEKLYVTGNIYATGNVTWGSSRELKEDIRDLTVDEALGALSNLHPKKYFYKADKDDEHLGFIAEDVPELLATEDRKSLDPMDIVGVLTKVVQEQQKVYQEQQTAMSELKREVRELMREINLISGVAMADNTIQCNEN